ncbi:hypothetical protein [Neobacillus sp. Marseille-QA0830]
MRGRKLLAFMVTVLFSIGFITPRAHAETAFQADKFPFQSMQVQIMPEFDYPEDWSSRDIPSLLISQYGTVTNKSGQAYDGKIEIPVPAADKGFEAILVADFPEKDQPEVQRPYDVDKEKGIISWKPSNPIKNNETYEYVIEYYTQTIDVKDQNSKTFTYEFKNNAEIEQLDIVYYAPMNSKDNQMEPKAQDNSKDDYGEELYFYQYNNVKIDEPLKYSFSYKKDGTESSMEAISKLNPPDDETHSGVTGTATDQITKGTKSSNSSKPIIGIGGASIIGIAIIIAGIFVYLGLKANSHSASKPAKSNKITSKKQTAAKKENLQDRTDEKKELRKKLLTGKIDQDTYEEEMKKLI